MTVELYPDIGTSYLYPESLVPDSEYVVLGKTADVTFANAEGSAVTLYDVELEEVWLSPGGNGDVLIPGDRITVLQPGGYTPGDAFAAARGGRQDMSADELVLQTVFGMPLPEVGDEYVLFLTEATGSAFSGVYAVTGVWQGRFRINGERVSRYRPPRHASYADSAETLDELRAQIADTLAGSVPRQPGFDKVLENYFEFIRDLEELHRGYILRYGDDESMAPSIESDERQIALLEQIMEELPDFYHGVLSRADGIAERAGERLSVLLLDGLMPCRAYGGDTFASVIIEKAGGVNAAGALTGGGRPVRVTMEEIRGLDPDIIVLSGVVQEDFRPTEKHLSDPAWQELRAVRDGRVYEAGPWFAIESNPGNTTVWMGVAVLQTALYPETYTEEQFRADREVYRAIIDPFDDTDASSAEG
ncbi:MAG: hypothetical protein IKD79_05830 [Oscillospiraceae bacterium]|nr:hypothetical protein [Oscillospiraceae bacterium]